MPKAYKIIQNGVVTYAPGNPKIKAHFESHNQDLMRFNKTKAPEAMVQVFDATEEEYQQHIAPKYSDKKVSKAKAAADENTLLREQLQAMQTQMVQMQGTVLQFLAGKTQPEQPKSEEETKPKRPYTKKQKDDSDSDTGEATPNE